jgi:hypothetical protein
MQAPTLIVRECPSGANQWSLHCELAGDAYIVRAPLYAAVTPTPFEHTILQGTMDGVGPAGVSARLAEAGYHKAESAIRTPEEALRRSGSANSMELAAKAIVLGEAAPRIDAAESTRPSLRHAALLAAFSIGMSRNEIAKMLGSTKNSIAVRHSSARRAIQTPHRAAGAHAVARAFASGALVVGDERYIPDRSLLQTLLKLQDA